MDPIVDVHTRGEGEQGSSKAASVLQMNSYYKTVNQICLALLQTPEMCSDHVRCLWSRMPTYLKDNLSKSYSVAGHHHWNYACASLRLIIYLHLLGFICST